MPAAVAGGNYNQGRADQQPEPVLVERNQWPEPLSSAAFHGVAGEFVRLVEPYSEADPAALLIQFLVEFGSILGRHGHFTAGADKHYTNLFAVLVGMSSKGRKGSSESAVRSVLRLVDEVWAREHVSSGLASGEGLIWQVRDPVETQEALREKGGVVTGYQAVISDAGVTDKRLLIVEPEFARVLKVCERESNTLSAIIRESWDNGNLRSLTKNNPGKATGAHISLIGHITRDELGRLLTDTATVNGFANRFLWVCTRRSKPLPDGDDLSAINFAPFMRELAEAVSFGRQAGLLKRDSDARDIWHREYEALSEGKPGLLGAATGRAEAQVMRLALIYALLDCSSFIRPEHLNAALAVWRYADQSAAFLFGNALGDPTADEILAALRSRPDGMTRLDIRNLFSGHKSSAYVSRALMSLVEHGLARFQKEDSGGRPTERWFTLSPAQKATKAQNLFAHSALTAQSEEVR